MNRYSVEWYHPTGSNGWQPCALLSNKRLALRTLRRKWANARGKFPFRLIDAQTGAVVQEKSRIG